MLTAITNSSRQNQDAHGKTKKLTAKPKTYGKIKTLAAQAKSSRQNKNSGQKQKANGKSKNSRQNQKHSRQKQLDCLRLDFLESINSLLLVHSQT